MTDWGARPLSARSTLFDPLHYNNGAVWPFVTGWVALAQYRYHNAHAGLFALEAIARTGFDESIGRNPEVLSGRIYKPLDTSVPHQFFATSMVLTPLVRGLLGIDVDAPAGAVTIAPHLPPAWDSVRVEHLAVGAQRLSFALRRQGRSLTLDVEGTREGHPVSVRFAPALPLGASVERSDSGAPEVEVFPGAVVASVRLQVRDRARAVVRLTGGWEAAVPSAAPRIGDRSSALRITSERMVNARYHLTVQGRVGRVYDLRVRGPDGALQGEVSIVPAGAGAARLQPSTADAGAWSTLRLTMPTTGGDDDGYVTLTLVR
jgi:hypothetical protein